MVNVFLSRHTPSLKPGDGEKIDFYIGEKVDVVSGADKGRQCIVLSERKWHPQAPGSGYVRECRFEDDGEMFGLSSDPQVWAKSESDLWPVDLGYRPSA